MNWKQELKLLKLQWIKKHHPDFYKLSGGDKMKTLSYNDHTTNGLSTAVYDWLKYSEHYCNRINTTGVARKINGKLQYTSSNTNRGTAIIDGKPVKIEIKCAATKDRISKYQQIEKQRIVASGGMYIVVTDMEMFVDWYHAFVSNIAASNCQPAALTHVQ